MNLLAISDLHLNPASSDRIHNFLQFLNAAKKNEDEILIVGDLFDLWFGESRLTFPYQKSIIDEMRNLAAAGLIMYYVEGNRDFEIGRYRGELFQEVSDTSFSIKWGTRRIFAEHGDLINLEDRPYRFWRRITKNRFSFFLLQNLPSFLLLRLSIYLEEKMKSTNVRYKSYYPEAYCKRFYETQFDKGNDIVVVGHFHEEREVQAKRDGKSVLFYNLPGWETGFRYLSIPQDDASPVFLEIR